MLKKIINTIRKKLFKKRGHFIYILSIFVIVIITRVPFMTKYLFEWDSVQLALGMNDFNIIKHQPHPPGYFLYIYISKFINLIIHNQNYSMIILNIIFTILSCFIIYKFSFKLLKKRTLSFLSSLIVITNPYVWFHGEFANVYMIDFLFALIFFYVSYEIIFEKKDKMLLFSLLFGIGTGFRQSLILFFGLMYVFVFFIYLKNSKKYSKKILINLLILGLSILLWLLPTIILSGGFEVFFNNTKNQYNATTGITSIFNPKNALKMLAQTFNTLKLLIYSSSIMFFLVMINLLTKKFKFTKNIKMLLWIWFLPSFLFCSFIHLGKIGYIMTLLPLIIILFICYVYRIKNAENKYFLIFIVLIFQSICFFTDFSVLRKYPSLDIFLVNIQPYEVSKIALEKNDRRIDAIITMIKKFDPDETIVVTEAGSPYTEYRKNFIRNIRFLNYYLPNYYNIYLYNEGSLFRVDIFNKRWETNKYDISIAKNTKNFLLVTNGYRYQKYSFEEIKNGPEKIYFKDISNIDNFEYIKFNFIKE